MLWGALFCLPAGFSFVTLRVSTLVLAWLTGVGVYRLLRACGSHETCALIAAASVLFCPVVFALAFTFMTDIPALAFGVWACVFAVRHADRPRWLTLCAATSLFVAATLVRQIGVTVAVGARRGVHRARTDAAQIPGCDRRDPVPRSLRSWPTTHF